MASIVKQIEAATIAALSSALDGAARVTGFRQSVAEGFVKTSDGDGRPEVIVSVSSATSQSYGSPILEYGVTVQVRLEWSDDPTLAKFDETAAAVEALFMRWNLREGRDDMAAALTTDNFRADGFKLSDGGGDSADVSGDRPAISTSQGFSVMGVYQTPEETQEE